VVIGGSGHIGSYLIPMLVNAGYEVVNVTRGSSTPYFEDRAWKKVTSVTMDRNDPMFEEILQKLNADIVVDLVCFNLEQTRRMTEILKKTDCIHYLFCSSAWEHGLARYLPYRPEEARKMPIDEYGRHKLESAQYLRELYRKEGFPVTIIMPGHISGPGWNIIGPWANTMLRPFQIIADGEELKLPNLGMETLNHVYAGDVAQCFFKSIICRKQALGRSFHATSGQALTLYGYACTLYEHFGYEPAVTFLPWLQWCDYVGDPDECMTSYCHIARSGYYGIEEAQRLIDYHPKYTSEETVRMAADSYIARGLIKV